ncbi:MAG: hypothetical protein K9L78_03035 [Victivallales bacterium]|nr:hypothetical protein [Victivallales bacterium]MCF7889072.1 hypothetical protein [Victivallales bacterium]
MINSIINKTTFITGNSKNAGKTTFLNYLLPLIRKKADSLCYMTIGIDGEKEDMIFGTPKPGITAEKNDYIVTCEYALTVTDAVFEVVEVFPFISKLGRLVLIRILRKGSIELIGPENNSQLDFILKYLREETVIKTNLIDGAVNRITQITSAPEAEFIYVMKVSQKNLIKSLNQIKTLNLVKKFPVKKEKDFEEEECFVCEGALTNIKASKIPEAFNIILINDFTKIFLNWNELSDLLKRTTVYYKEKFHLNFISVNLFDITREDFNQALTKNCINEKVVFNPYEYI